MTIKSLPGWECGDTAPRSVDFHLIAPAAELPHALMGVSYRADTAAEVGKT
jgi:hypothetical protein